MTTTKQEAGPRPADLDPQAVWPPRVSTPPAVTTTDRSVVRSEPSPEGALGVRVGRTPMPGGLPRMDHVTVPAATTTTQVPAPRAAAKRVAKGAAGK